MFRTYPGKRRVSSPKTVLPSTSIRAKMSGASASSAAPTRSIRPARAPRPRPLKCSTFQDRIFSRI
ncbi:hypothetical protein [Mangrovicoccus ximenensis]|uniref:hypothetical protein n=1 Tax=Mangrovicoccus ximenensis TaxID=1911570 RepID=UPI000D371CFD|nr:hypothetical protein [Mangrovicoccus ximenensis]